MAVKVTKIIPPAPAKLVPVSTLHASMHLIERLPNGDQGDVKFFQAGTPCEVKLIKVRGWVCTGYFIGGKVYTQI